MKIIINEERYNLPLMKSLIYANADPASKVTCFLLKEWMTTGVNQ